MLKRFWDSWGKELVAAVILAVIIRVGLAESRVVPTPSMVPTVQVGDRILAEKIFFKLFGLHRGDIIVFNPPFAPEANPITKMIGLEDDYLKRIIGMAGDTIEVRDGKVYRNGVALDEPYIMEPMNYVYGPVKVPEGKLFVMGDNRNNSNDSHAWGFLDVKEVRSRAIFRFWPLNRIGILH